MEEIAEDEFESYAVFHVPDSGTKVGKISFKISKIAKGVSFV